MAVLLLKAIPCFYAPLPKNNFFLFVQDKKLFFFLVEEDIIL